MRQETKSSFYIIVAGILWGLIGIFTRLMSSYTFNSVQITFSRMGIATLVFAFYLLIFDRDKFKIDFRDLWMFLGTGLFSIFLHNITMFYAVINGEASIASVLINTSPIFIMLASALLFKEKITKRKIVALCMTFSGCVCVSGFLSSNMTVKPIVILVGIVSGFLYAMYTIFSRYALKKYSNLTVNMYTYFFAFCGSLFVVDISKTMTMICSSFSTASLCFANSIITCMLPFIFYTAGLKHVENSKAAILVAFDPIVSTLVGIFVLKESSSFIKILGCILIILSIVVLNTKSNKKGC